MSSFDGGYTNATIQSAVANSLYSRGNGTGSDGDAGWDKVWRAACWARLNNTDMAYLELAWAVQVNFAGNGLSMYSEKNPPFQIDANFGFGGAVLGMLIVDLPGLQSVVLGPAIPAAWGGGSVEGMRLRGGGSVDFGWDKDGLVTSARVDGRDGAVRIVNREGDVLVNQS